MPSAPSAVNRDWSEFVETAAGENAEGRTAKTRVRLRFHPEGAACSGEAAPHNCFLVTYPHAKGVGEGEGVRQSRKPRRCDPDIWYLRYRYFRTLEACLRKILWLRCTLL